MQSSADDHTVEEIMATEKAWVQAHLDLDLEALDRIMADEYLAVGASGELIDKQETLASYGSGQRHWEVAEGHDYLVRVYSETGVVIGRWRGVGMNRGTPFDYSARFISVYVRRDGRWQMVTAQSTTLENYVETGK
jgi:ketosteroid isomerase-like protein